MMRASGGTVAIPKRVGAAILATALAGCAGARRGPADNHLSRAPGSSGLFVFLRDGGRDLSAADVTAASVQREDGGLVVLQVVPVPATEIAAGQERVWLSGWIPAGPYVGLELEYGPEAKVDVPFPFTAAADGGTVLVAERPPPTTPGAVPGSASSLILSKPDRIASGLLGLVSVRGWDAVEIIDKRSGRVVGVVPVGRGPAGLAIDAHRLRGYVALAGDDAVAVLDLLEERVRERIVLRGGDSPSDLAVTPDGRTLLVANAGSDTVSFVDTVSAAENERVAVGARPVSVVMALDGRRAYVVAESGTAVTVLDVAARTVVGTIATDAGPVQARLGGRAGEILYVAHRASPYLLVVDAATLSLVRRVYVGNGARALEVEPRTGRVLLSRAGQRKVEVFDPGSFLPVDQIALPGDAVWLALETEGNAIGILLGEPHELDLIGNVGRRVLFRAAIGPDPSAMRFVDAQ
jgi:YVTN family beta-propeller protein